MKFANKINNIVALLVFLPITASATTLSGNLTADDEFTAYLSTNDSVAGTSLASGNAWPFAQSFSTTLTPGNTYYLHIAARDVYGVISAFLGSFNLSDANFAFANGTQSLVTNSTDWGVNASGFGSAYGVPHDFGANGVLPWNTLGSIASDAHWIWTGPNSLGDAYFTTTITPVPEPEAYAMLLAGLGLLGFMAYRGKQSS